MKTKGIIEWINTEPKMFNGQWSIGIKINNTFYNKYSQTDKELILLLERLKKGYEVELTHDNKIVTDIQVLSTEVNNYNNISKAIDLLDEARRILFQYRNFKT